MALEDGKDFVAGNYYLAYYDEYQPAAPFLLKCKRTVDGFPIFSAVDKEGNGNISSTVLMQHTNCTVSGDRMSVRAASNVAHAYQLMNGIGMGSEWHNFLTNKYGDESTERLTVRRSAYEDRLAEDFLFDIMSDNGPEDKGKYCFEHQTDEPVKPLTRAEKLNAARNIAAVVVELDRETKFTVQDETVKLVFRGRYAATRPHFLRFISVVEKSIKDLGFFIGTYYLEKEY